MWSHVPFLICDERRKNNQWFSTIFGNPSASPRPKLKHCCGYALYWVKNIRTIRVKRSSRRGTRLFRLRMVTRASKSSKANENENCQPRGNWGLKGGFPLSRNFYMRTHVNFAYVNKIETISGPSEVQRGHPTSFSKTLTCYISR